MRAKHIPVLGMLLFISCSKEDNSISIDDTISSDQPIPVNDLGSGNYMGSTGGLYPGGANNPSGTYADDLFAISQSIVPIDTFGNPSPKGEILFISLGASTGGHNMALLKIKTKNHPAANPKLKLLNCNTGSGDASLNSIKVSNSLYWNHVTQIIAGTKSSYRQVQLIYLESDDSSRNISWPSRPNLVKNDVEACLRVIKQKFPNIKVVYLLGRTRTFDANAMWNREPSPYYFGWGCKWAIEDQINGVQGTEYKGSNAVAPMVTWGFYQWADSLPRTTDNFYWRYSETEDGLHANLAGQDTLASRFQKFLLADKCASLWYLAQ